MHADATPTDPQLRVRKATGIVLIAVSILEVVAMAHHPTAGNVGIAAVIERIGHLSALAATVHAALIALMTVSYCCLIEYAMWRGLRRPLVRAGVVIYGVGIITMIGAALVSGFVLESVAQHLPHDTPAALQSAAQWIDFCVTLNQTLANTGAIAMSVAIACWSIELLREKGLARALAALGILVGLLPIVGIPLGLIHLDVHGMGLVVLLEAVWMIGIGLLLQRAPQPA